MDDNGVEGLNRKGRMWMRNNKGSNTCTMLLFCLLFMILLTKTGNAASGGSCTSASPCSCGADCQGGTNELSGYNSTFCSANPTLCYNTVDDCKDGIYGLFEYVNDITITSLNNTVFRPGDTIEVDVDIFSGSAAWDGVFILYANHSATDEMNWTVVYSGGFAQQIASKHFKVNVTLDDIPANHTIRAIVEYNQYEEITCGRGLGATWPLYSDTEDVSFYVEPDDEPPTINFTGPTPPNGSTLTTAGFSINVTHNDTRPHYIILNWNGENQTPLRWSRFDTSFNVSNLGQGNYTYQVWINDTSGNVNTTETRYVQILRDIDISVAAPQESDIYGTSEIWLNYSTWTNVPASAINWTAYSLNGGPNNTILNPINLSFDISDTDGQAYNMSIGTANITQSFLTSESIAASSVYLSMMRFGNGTENATITINQDTEGIGLALAYANITSSNISNESLLWVRLELNSTVQLQPESRYWIVIHANGTNSNYLAFETNNDSVYQGGNMSGSDNYDILFRFFSDRKYKKLIVADEGTNTLTISSADTYGSVATSNQITFISDTTPPGYSGPNLTYPTVELGQTQEIKITQEEACSGIGSLVIEINSSNRSMNSADGLTYSYQIKPNSTGLITYRIFLTDRAGNANITTIANFSVIDSASPVITNISNSPNTSALIDPNALITVRAGITDQNNISSVILQYKNSTASLYDNATMSEAYPGTYNASFIPVTSGTWEYRIYAIDNSGNEAYSNSTEVVAEYDWTWEHSPYSIDAIGAVIGSETGISNITVVNTGDYGMAFNITSSDDNTPAISFNSSNPITLEPGSNTTINVNATAPELESSYPIKILLRSLNSSSIPQIAYANTTLFTYSSGPYLVATITSIDSTVTIGDRIRMITGKVSNIGNETANDVTARFTLPSGWVSASDMNESFGPIPVGQSRWMNISAEVQSGTLAGSQTVAFFTNCSENKQYTDTASVLVLAEEQGGQQQNIPGTTGGTGTSGSSGGLVYINGSADPEKFIAITGPDKTTGTPNSTATFRMKISNIHQSKALHDIRISLSGYYIIHTDIDPKEIDKLEPGQSRMINFYLYIPHYLTSSSFNLNISAVGRTQNDANEDSWLYASTSAQIMLYTGLLDYEGIIKLIYEAEKSIDSMKAAGIMTKLAEASLLEAREALESGDLESAQGLANEIITMHNKAISLINDIEDMRKAMLDSRQFDSATLAIIKKAEEALYQGNLDLAESLISQAGTAIRIRNLSPHSISISAMLDWARVNIRILTLSSVIFLLIFLSYRNSISLRHIKDSIDKLSRQEDSVLALIKKTQEQYYVNKMMSRRLFDRSMDALRDRMTKIQAGRINLSARKASILAFLGTAAQKEKEIDSLRIATQRLQEDYFIKKTINERFYLDAKRKLSQRIATLKSPKKAMGIHHLMILAKNNAIFKGLAGTLRESNKIDGNQNKEQPPLASKKLKLIQQSSQKDKIPAKGLSDTIKPASEKNNDIVTATGSILGMDKTMAIDYKGQVCHWPSSTPHTAKERTIGNDGSDPKPTSGRDNGTKGVLETDTMQESGVRNYQRIKGALGIDTMQEAGVRKYQRIKGALETDTMQEAGVTKYQRIKGALGIDTMQEEKLIKPSGDLENSNFSENIHDGNQGYLKIRKAFVGI